ncbi:hypothetical protein ACFU8W_29685 [Streptomyces sp. NPDC057565]|uniref:hypothetical protein n=1 Tax=Streptomyces sp. NPDC057565 TaxID=3346169 RepID=UPI0036CCA842
MRRLRALVALTAFALPVTGCGIRASEVVEVGDPATVDVAAGSQEGTLLYFVSSSSPGTLLPVVRQIDMPREAASSGTGDSGTGDLKGSSGKALVLLFEGPSRTERDAGMSTELPRSHLGLSMAASRSGVLVRLEGPVTGLSGLAQQQLICTAVHSGVPDPGAAVTLSGTDGSVGPAHCTV